ncbi:hypothetical protein [Bdellovibrio reynosensis]|uniref:Uncharacterized protein n=1 Tax=Bdellovibrio reynosensis TaxID=2835041 RepID=A0ABY4C832_9BACT|nr:hypothetical protein [Bdellovibrio reynosensis]UOF00629.1 hypothetical protein MNR06_13075 [Bdellovibrio reynosensis]
MSARYTTLFFLVSLMPLFSFAKTTTPVGCVGKNNISPDAHAAWILPAKNIVASEKAEGSPNLEIGQRTAVMLKNNGKTSSGFVGFKTKDAGDYFLSSDFYPRMNVTDLESKKEMQVETYGPVRECDTIRKSLRFKFKGNHKYSLELISKDSKEINVLVIKANN